MTSTVIWSTVLHCIYVTLSPTFNQNLADDSRIGGLDGTEQCFTSSPKQYRLYGRRFLQVKRPNQQYQSTEKTNSTQRNQTYNKHIWTQNTASSLVHNNMGWLGDGSHIGQGCQAWTAVGLALRYPLTHAYTQLFSQYKYNVNVLMHWRKLMFLTWQWTRQITVNSF